MLSAMHGPKLRTAIKATGILVVVSYWTATLVEILAVWTSCTAAVCPTDRERALHSVGILFAAIAIFALGLWIIRRFRKGEPNA